MNLPNGDILDCKQTECFVKYANDVEGSDTGFKNNCIISMEGDDVVLVATRDIESGEEIFVEYGENYWQQNSYRLS